MVIDVYLDTGVCVSLPNGTDLKTDEGLRLAKNAAAEKLLILIESKDFDIHIEHLEE